MGKILVTGALGQIGSELTTALREKYGDDNVIASDIKEENPFGGRYVQLNVLDTESWKNLLKEEGITQVYHLAAMLSGVAEKFPMKAWDLNTKSFMSLLEMAREGLVEKIFWPSSIAVYGKGARKYGTPQSEVQKPLSMYGIAKLAGERLCDYYNTKYGVDVRSIRYPGLISWKTLPGGGTTDYAVDIYYKALEDGKYECFLKEDSTLPMLYMNDAIKATIQLMEADKEQLTVHSSYNLGGLSFNPKEIAEVIKTRIPEFEITYNPDFRQAIADSWPAEIDDSVAVKDWGWKPDYDLEAMTDEMLKNLRIKLDIQ
ncbi:NAD-dependent epimerase/dehydratase family protein [Ornithobacterium rhinotracheale]|uniref:NAD-dependent epimerase/dehydratase family protein n=1 Tax=Ornithobacterium rhinotracheale TaxID=28251 RepID=UPI00129D0600|nr:NAD-dependent epimerase/dehydratase family protein [Ornithobacterium rhinotracheale]MRJ10705.1 NAD-dependent epimerase/dehydratase family protein [Ornithobacterium rhinotracheale]